MPARPATITSICSPLTALTYMWAQMAETALAAKANGGASDPYYDSKLATGPFSSLYVERVLPEAGAHLAKLKARRCLNDGAAGGGVLIQGPTYGRSLYL